MTVKEVFEKKYKEYMANISKKAWENHKFYAEAKNIPVFEHIMLCIEITEKELRENGFYYECTDCELVQLHKSKYLASNRHKSDCRNPSKFWLTNKGYKQLFAE